MYIRLSGADEFLSWKLVKNPDSIFERRINDLRKITGQFTPSGAYEAFLDNDPLLFLEKFRESNMSNYLNPLSACVSPFNLVLLTEVFRSALHGRADKTIPQEEVEKPYMYTAIVGPFAEYNLSILEDVLGAANLSYSFSETDEENKPLRDRAQMLTIMGYENLANFLQKIYVACFASTASLDFLTTVGEDSKQEMIVGFCGEWINNLADKVFFVKKLSKFHKGIAEKFLKRFNIAGGKDFLDEGDELFKDSLHEQRHFAVAYLLMKVAPDDEEFSVLELGSGTGQFFRKLSPDINFKYVGVEANGIKVERAKEKNRNGTFLHGNILAPMIHEKHLMSNAVVLTEVIEHLTESDRKTLIGMFKDFYLSDYIFITTPNKDFNVNYGLTSDQKRHKDHEIEYNFTSLFLEVISPLQQIGYEIAFHDFETNVISEEDAQKLPSFILSAKYIGEKRKFNYRKYNDILALFSEFYLPNTGQTVKAQTIMKGFNSRQFATKQDIFYLGPTIAPAEYSENHPEFLEHPLTVFEYYAGRGNIIQVVEKKYMGSRGYILAFRDEELAKSVGHKLITINSKSGFEFFDADKIYQFNGINGTKSELEAAIHAEIFKNCAHDFIMLDCEIMPWLLKAGKLVEKDFELPGQVELLFNRYTGKDTTNVWNYFNALWNYTQEHDVEIRVFDILAKGMISSRTNKYGKTIYNYTNVVMGATQDKFDVNYKITNLFYGNKIVLPVEYVVHNHMAGQSELIVEKWLEDCKNGAEGIVIKPVYRTHLLDSGFPLQQAIKVRGPEYLRLVYGINYTKPEYFTQVKKRNVKKKRQTAAVQAELSYNILRAFLNRDNAALQRYVAAFIAIDNESARIVDATL